MSDPRESPATRGEASAHPDTAQLVSWLRGELDAGEAERVDSHLEACEQCAARLEEINPPRDAFVERLRDAAGLHATAAAVAARSGDDANLLFGSLALQAGFITAQQFADACLLWASRGGTPLAEILVEAGWIDGAARATVEALLAARKPAPSSRALAETLRGSEPGRLGVDDPSAVSPLSAQRIKLRTLHSTGGIGQVWRAHDTFLDREVALKELLPELRGSRVHRERFFREARVAAQLAHPGTAPVYEYREEGGRCFYTMKFLAGRTFTEVIRRAHDQARDATHQGTAFERLFPLIEDFLAICDTIAYAHAHGVIHRDLKGDNVIIGDFGEVTVIDWGLAKAIATPSGQSIPASESPTIQGERLGTPGYMAPEQARGDLGAIDQRTDVYGLAAVLYEVLTCRPPFAGQTANETMHLVETAAPAPPSLSHAETPPELEAICLRGLAKRPEDRFASAADLRDAVRAWLTDQADRRVEAEQQARFFSLSRDLFVTLSDSGEITHVNRAYRQLLGYEGDEPTGKNYADTLHPEDRERAARLFSLVKQGEAEQDFVVRVERAGGGYETISWSVSRALDEPVVYAVGRPLDEESEQRRRANERATFFSLSRDLFVAFDADNHITHTNPAYVDFFGYPEQESLGKSYLTKVHPDDKPLATERITAARSGAAPEDFVVRVQRRDGHYCPVNWSLTKSPGEPTTYAVGRPLDEASLRRRATEARGRFFSLSPDLFVIADERGNAGQINEAWTTLLGLKPEDVVGRPFSEFVHPDDVGPATRAGRRALLRDSVIDLETRMPAADGTEKTIAWTLTRIPGQATNYAIGRDVTRQRRADQRLRAILDAGPEALLVVDHCGRIDFTNAVLRRLFGYEPGELEGGSLDTLLPAEHRAAHQEHFERYVASPVVRSMGRGGAFPAVRKDGAALTVQISLSPLRVGNELLFLAAIQPVETGS